MASGITPIESSPTTEELATWLNDELLPVLDDLLRSDNTLADSEVRHRHLHPEVGALFTLLEAHLVNGARLLVECRLATIGNHGLTGLSGIDGITPDVGDRILVRAQTDPTENGVYVAAAGAWTRADDADTMAELGYCAVFVDQGDSLQATNWLCDAGTDGTIGTVDVVWKKIGGGLVGPQGADGPQGPQGDPGSDGADGEAAGPGDIGETELADHAATNPKLGQMPAGTVKANLTGILADADDVDLEDLKDALDDLAGVPSLTLISESDAPTYAHSFLVATANDGVIAFGGSAGKCAKFNWTTYAWDNGTITGPTAVTYTWAKYIPGSDLIWAGNNVKVHAIDPTTLAATDITANTGALVTCAYNPVTDMVYGFGSSTTTIKEMDPATGVVARTYAEALMLSGGYAIACHPTTGDIVILANNTGVPAGGGDIWFVIPAVAFNAHTFATVVTAQTPGASAPSMDAIAIDPVNNVAVLGWSAYYWLFRFDIAAGTQKFSNNSRNLGGSLAVYHPTNGKLYLMHGQNRRRVSIIDPTHPYLEAVATVVLENFGATSFNHMCIGYDGYLYLISAATAGRITKVAP